MVNVLDLVVQQSHQRPSSHGSDFTSRNEVLSQLCLEQKRRKAFSHLQLFFSSLDIPGQDHFWFISQTYYDLLVTWLLLGQPLERGSIVLMIPPDPSRFITIYIPEPCILPLPPNQGSVNKGRKGDHVTVMCANHRYLSQPLPQTVTKQLERQFAIKTIWRCWTTDSGSSAKGYRWSQINIGSRPPEGCDIEWLLLQDILFTKAS